MATSDGNGPDGGGLGLTPTSSQAEPWTSGEAAAAATQPSDLPTPGQHPHDGLWKLTLGSVGVVHGDVGTSPIYAMRESLHAAGGEGPIAPADVVGVISLLLWRPRSSSASST